MNGKGKRRLKHGDGEARDPTPYLGVVEDVIEAVPNDPLSRQFLLIDAVREDEFIRDSASAAESPDSLALVRIMSTPKRLNDMFGLAEVRPGNWLSFELDNSGGIPRAWEMRASENYASRRSRSVRGMRRIEASDGAARTSDGDLLTKLINAAVLQAKDSKRESAADAIEQIGVGGQIEIVVLDVGQASANLIRRNGQPIGFFDLGSPLWFNRGSFPIKYGLPALPSGFVILSHWDFDHFELGRRNAPYHQLRWFAPDQPVGLNTARFQKQLGHRLTFIDGPAAGGGFRMSRGISKVQNDRNGTGYLLRYEAEGKAALLTADASYDNIDPTMLSGVSRLTIPHHGAASTILPPPAVPPSRAVASFGLPNKYRHPDPQTLADHASQKWRIEVTAAFGGRTRGNKMLFP